MQTSTFNTPALYGDHHVIEVREQLSRLPGVSEVNASSAFQIVEVTYDEAQVTCEALQHKLEELGYLTGLDMPVESGVPQPRSQDGGSFREPAVYDNLPSALAFQQHVKTTARQSWNCPGMGVVPTAQDN